MIPLLLQKDEHVEKLSLFISSWNLGNAAPPKSLAPWIPLKAYDIYVIAAQVENACLLLSRLSITN